jgi:hypothetical protein
MEVRKIWLEHLQKLSEPVLKAAASNSLKSSMNIKSGGYLDRSKFAPLEAVSRLLCGISPWLELEEVEGEELRLQTNYIDMAHKAIKSITDENSADYLDFNTEKQPLVDAAFLAQAICRAPNRLWFSLEEKVQQQVIRAMVATRNILPAPNNWLLFSAMIEAFFYKFGFPWDKMRVDYALRQHEQWYVGDGHYSDGVKYHADYYNSFVILPMLIDIIENVDDLWSEQKVKLFHRSARYAELLEKSISPTGTYPPIGRSIIYRGAAFHLLAQQTYRGALSENLTPQQVKGALSAVITQTLTSDGTYDDNGWLQIGLKGHQPSLAESYISTGSLYLCSLIFIPLGLSKSNSFWSEPSEPWSQKLIWEDGADFKADSALND